METMRSFIGVIIQTMKLNSMYGKETQILVIGVALSLEKILLPILMLAWRLGKLTSSLLQRRMLLVTILVHLLLFQEGTQNQMFRQI